jgi:hypothetical protein
MIKNSIIIINKLKFHAKYLYIYNYMYKIYIFLYILNLIKNEWNVKYYN